MKTSFKILGINVIAALFAFTIMQSFTTAAADVTPADGCAYVDNANLFCVWGDYAVTHCANTTSKTTCGVNIPNVD
jgi:hypothetical protein